MWDKTKKTTRRKSRKQAMKRGLQNLSAGSRYEKFIRLSL